MNRTFAVAALLLTGSPTFASTSQNVSVTAFHCGAVLAFHMDEVSIGTKPTVASPMLVARMSKFLAESKELYDLIAGGMKAPIK